MSPRFGPARASLTALPIAWIALVCGAEAQQPAGGAAAARPAPQVEPPAPSRGGRPAPAIAAKAAALATDTIPTETDRGLPVATPPSTILVPSQERVPVGTPLNRVLDLMRAHPNRRSSIAAEAPQQRVRVESFHVMAHEVTNEQYLAFVEATGHRPPDHWGQPAIEAGRRAELEAVARARREAREAGKTIPDPAPFYAQDWWDQNWRTAEWKMPPNLASVPVTWVDYGDAIAYARWAGMRLLTEAEFQAAARGEDPAREFPWGNTWEAGRAATAMGGQSLPVPVGRYRSGASPRGVQDLIGNVWEWTASPFVALPGYKPIEAKQIDRNAKDGDAVTAAFDPDYRIVVGGSVQNDSSEVRLGIRLGAARYQRTAALGFRLAASPRPGVDRATSLPHAQHFGDSGPGFTRLLAVDRWHTAEGTGNVRVSDEGENLYAVVTAYEHVLVLPPERLGQNNLAKLNEDSTANPVVIGVMSTSLPLATPALPAGEYVVSYRAAGRDRRPPARAGQGGAQAGGQAEATEATSALDGLVDPAHPSFVFSTTDGRPVTAIRAPAARFEVPPREAPNGKIAVVRGGEKPGEHDALVTTLVVPGRASQSNAFVFDLRLEFTSGALAGPWRR